MIKAHLFSLLHLDTNEDGVLDEQELEALFTKEVCQSFFNISDCLTSCMNDLFYKTLVLPQLEKVYDPKNEEDDMMEMEEERLRMREHVMNNVGLVYLSRHIFLTSV